MDDSLEDNIHQEKLKPLRDSWLEIQNVLGCTRLDAAAVAEKAFIELRAIELCLKVVDEAK